MTQTENKTAYHHFGNDYSDENIENDEKYLYFTRYPTAYEIISENDLDSYFTQENSLEIPLRNKKKSDGFENMDDQEAVKQLLDFQELNYEKTILHIPQVHCNSYIWLLKQLIKFDSGLTQKEINYIKKELTLGYSPPKKA